MATLTTKLDAVNTMLGYVTEAPVNSIANTTSLPPSAALAKGVIDEVSREVQQDGWHFNTAQDYKLEANASNKFVLPDNVLQVDTVDTTYDVVQRGTTLFDRKNYTDTFTVDELKVNITFLLEYEELPEQARRYIALKASRMFATDLLAPVRLRHLFTVMRFAPRQLWKKLKVTTLIEPFSTTTTLLHVSASTAALTLLKRWPT